MKTSIRTTLATVAVIAIGAVSAQAQWTYVDATDFLHDSSGDGTSGSGPSANTWLDAAGTSPWSTDLGDGTDKWRYRWTGPGNAANGNTAWQGRSQEGDPPLFTIVTGLTPDSEYTIAVYAVYGGSKPSWAVSSSLDAGTSWSGPITYESVNAAQNLGYGQGWVTADGDPLSEKDGDTRGNVIVGTTMTDSSGTLVVGVQHIGTAVGIDRAAYDGIAYAPGVVPEPTTFALTGLGAAALLIFRRRK